jgi:glycine dehydrogenase
MNRNVDLRFQKSIKKEKAVYPLPFVKARKFWPSVSRIDNAYGDRNLFCSCIPAEEYEQPVIESVK